MTRKLLRSGSHKQDVVTSEGTQWRGNFKIRLGRWLFGTVMSGIETSIDPQ